MKKRIIKNQKGFTLIEIIAVLVILGILAAVAVPKYFDLQDQARLKAVQGAVSEVKGLLNLAYGKATLVKGGAPTTAEVEAQLGTAANSFGDFVGATADAGGTGVAYSVSHSVAASAAAGYSATGTWLLP